MTINFTKPLLILIALCLLTGAVLANAYQPQDFAAAEQIQAQTAALVERVTNENAYLKGIQTEDLARYQKVTSAVISLVGFGVWMGYALQVSVTSATVIVLASGSLSLAVLWGSNAYAAFKRARFAAVVTDLGGGLKEVKNTAKGMVVSTVTGRTHPTDTQVESDAGQVQIETVRLLASEAGRVAKENKTVDLFIRIIELLPGLTRNQFERGFYREVRK